MSLYTFATANFTTTDDLRRRPAIDTWQIVRTLAFVIVVFLAMFIVARSERAVQPADEHQAKVSSPISALP